MFGKLKGRDENVSKNGRRQRRQRRRSTSTSRIAQSGRRRPVEKVSGRRRPVGKRQDGRRRPVEQLHDGVGRRRPVERSVVDGRRCRRQADVFITPQKMKFYFRKLPSCEINSPEISPILVV